MSGTNAPPGGGPNGVVIASSDQLQTNTQPNADATKITQPAVPDANALNLEPVAAAQVPATSQTTNTEVPDYGDNGLNIAADYFVNTLGLDINGRELTEAAKGNFALLEAKLEILGDKAKGSGPILKLAQDSVARLADGAKAQQAQTVTAVHTAVGGEANWKAVQQYARTNLPADQLKEASDALSSGGLAAIAMARHLLSLATTNPNVSTQGQAATDPNAVAESLQGVAPLTRDQYRAEYKKLNQKYGINGVGKSAELAALNARFQP